MTDDLVMRLQGGFPTSQGFSGYYPDVTKAVSMMNEAAARIEADAATIARLQRQLDYTTENALWTLAERQRDFDAVVARLEAAEAKVAALVGELASIANDLSCTDARGRKYADRIIAAIAAAKGGA